MRLLPDLKMNNQKGEIVVPVVQFLTNQASFRTLQNISMWIFVESLLWEWSRIFSTCAVRVNKSGKNCWDRSRSVLTAIAAASERKFWKVKFWNALWEESACFSSLRAWWQKIFLKVYQFIKFVYFYPWIFRSPYKTTHLKNLHMLFSVSFVLLL